MPKSRDQMTPTEPDDRSRLAQHRGQGTGGTGYDLLPGEAAGPGEAGEARDDGAVEAPDDR